MTKPRYLTKSRFKIALDCPTKLFYSDKEKNFFNKSLEDPLKKAHDSGGSSWDEAKKEAFANDPENLVITNKKYNRTKSSKGIDKWLPVSLNFTCKYVKDFLHIKTQYKLELKTGETQTVELLKKKCGM
jgi:hypothetical protein